MEAMTTDMTQQASAQNMTPLEAINHADALFRQRDLQGAADICRQISEQLPHFVPADILMSEIYMTLGDLQLSLTFIQRALNTAPEDRQAKFQRIKIWLMLKRWKECAIAIEDLLETDPDNGIYLTVKADVMVKLGRAAEALPFYDRAVQHTNNYIPLLSKADCLMAMQRNEEAVTLLEELIERPADVDGRAYYLLSKALVNLQQHERAEGYCIKATQISPNLADAWRYLAIFAHRSDNKENAVKHAYHAIKVDPNLQHAYFILARSLTDLKRYAEAERVLRKALEQWPDNIVLEEELRNILISTKQHNEAIKYIELALERDPDNKELHHLLYAMQGKTTDTAPEQYVSKLFDQYAESFDDHLVDQLKYSTPQKLASAIREALVLDDLPTHNLSLLDLGCGTGLAAEALKLHTNARFGVDLSQKMVDIARNKGLYQDVCVDDIVRFMHQDSRSYDMVVSADVLVYVGNLEPFMKAARRVLKPRGLLAFSVEDGDDNPPFTIRKTGRYAHSQAYVETLADENSYAVKVLKQTELRKDMGESIMGHLFVLQPQTIN